MRKSVMAGIVATGAIGAALAVGGVAYAASNGDETGRGEQIVRVVEDDGTGGYSGTGNGRDCPNNGGTDKGGDQGGDQGNAESSSGENL